MYKIFACCYLWCSLITLFIIGNFIYWLITGKEYIHKETAQDVYNRRERDAEPDDR